MVSTDPRQDSDLCSLRLFFHMTVNGRPNVHINFSSIQDVVCLPEDYAIVLKLLLNPIFTLLKNSTFSHFY